MSKPESERSQKRRLLVVLDLIKFWGIIVFHGSLFLIMSGVFVRDVIQNNSSWPILDLAFAAILASFLAKDFNRRYW